MISIRAQVLHSLSCLFFLNNAQYCFKNVSSMILLFNGIFSFVIDLWRFGLYVIYWIRSSWYDKLIWIKELLCQWIIVDTLDSTHYSPSSGSPNQSVQHHKILTTGKCAEITTLLSRTIYNQRDEDLWTQFVNTFLFFVHTSLVYESLIKVRPQKVFVVHQEFKYQVYFDRN